MPVEQSIRWGRIMGVAAVVALAIALVLALAANTFLVNMETRAAAPRDGGRLVTTTIAQANVRVEGQGPAVVLIHGFSAALDWWDEIAPSLARTHRVIRLDLLGHGGTAAPRAGYEIERQAALVAAVLDKLDVDRISVIGHSMGGEVATALLEARPDRIDRLVLIDTPPTEDTTFDLVTRAYLFPVLGQALTHWRTDSALGRGLAQGFALGFAVPPRFIADARQLTYTASRSAHDASVAYRRWLPMAERLAQVKPVPPLLVIMGALDAIVPARSGKLYEQVPGARVVVLDGVGHSPMVEAPSKTIDLLELFLTSAPRKL
jgi:pimeloyl-ACP methyl ester carboxylesterase